MLTTYYILHTTPVYAAGVDIGEAFGFGNITSLGQGTSFLVPAIFSVASFLVIFYFLLGAFTYLRAGGNKEEVEKGRQMITHGVVGFLILMFAFFILQFILSSLFKTDFSIIRR